jgi:hypothetical protein
MDRGGDRGRDRAWDREGRKNGLENARIVARHRDNVFKQPIEIVGKNGRSLNLVHLSHLTRALLFGEELEVASKEVWET